MSEYKSSSNIHLVLFSLTLFLSASLMFSLQPMVGKMLLPIVGGTPAGWITALAFFQVMLLGGYFLAHALSRFQPHVQGLAYLLCLGIGCFFLPIALNKHADLVSSSPMATDVFVLLTAAVAIPFIALSATSSTLQRLFTTTKHASAQDPYFLYAASNLGSFAGLLLYPFIVEPNTTLSLQSHGWLFGYVALIVMTILCLMVSDKKSASLPKNPTPLAAIGWKRRLEWICLAFIPSGLLLAVTTHITTDIFSVPLLWVLPLGIYLLTFIIAFSKKPVIPYHWVLKAQPIAVSCMIAITLMVTSSLSYSLLSCALNLAAFTVVALMCHMRLAQLRPVEDPRHLTDFYLMIALGGALGGILNAFIAPVIFARLQEYPLLMIASCLFNDNLKKKISNRYVYFSIAAYVLIAVLAFMHMRGALTPTLQDALLVLIFILVTLHPKLSLAGSIVVFIGISTYTWVNPLLLNERNFYGVIKVYDRNMALSAHETVTTRYMSHGTTLHGTQILQPNYEMVPTTYYTREGPLNDVINLIHPKAVAAVGLGTGSINCYATPERQITFFEINPAVIDIAQQYFTYLSKCGTGMPRIILGDARLELQKLENEKFDLIVLDAFSSDTLPTHLLTKEAVETYLERLTPGGFILFHISNRFFTLEAPITAIGESLGLQNAMVTRILPQPYAASSKWIALTRQSVRLLPLAEKGWVRAYLRKEIKPWTDDYTGLLNIMNF